MREEAELRERRQTQELMVNSMKTFDETIQLFSASKSDPNARLPQMNPSEYLQYQLSIQRQLQEEVNRLKSIAVSSANSNSN
jgi:hypothetical protein